MKHLKLIVGIACAVVLTAGCSRHPKADFSVPTESTETAAATETTQPFTAPTEPEQPGFDSPDAAYDAYLAACEAQDVDAFCALFSQDEIANAGSVPSKFLRNRFGVKLDADYKSYQIRTGEDAFRRQVMANFNSYQSAMTAFGQSGESWTIEPGSKKAMQQEEVQSFANSLHLNITQGSIRSTFYFVGNTSEARVEGDSVYLLCIDGRWYPSYTKQCVPLTISISDLDPEYASESTSEREG